MNLLWASMSLSVYHLCVAEYMRLVSKLQYSPKSLTALDKRDLLFFHKRLRHIRPYPHF